MIDYSPQYCVRYVDYLKQKAATVVQPLPVPLSVQRARAAEAARKLADYAAEREAA
jgi:hypothetical protein